MKHTWDEVYMMYTGMGWRLNVGLRSTNPSQVVTKVDSVKGLLSPTPMGLSHMPHATCLPLTTTPLDRRHPDFL